MAGLANYSKPPARDRSEAAVAYLKLYNALQMIGWISACLITLAGLYMRLPVWILAGFTVQLCQGAAFLEVLHVLLGIVRGSVLMTFLQWFGRANVLFAVLSCIPEVQRDPGVGLVFTAWSLAEVVRYPWYLSMLLETPSPRLTWLRYSAFIILYPMGVVGELMITWHALPYIKQRRLHSLSLPNAVNLGFDYHLFCQVGVFGLIPVAFMGLYTYMLQQRTAKLSAGRQTNKQRQE